MPKAFTALCILLFTGFTCSSALAQKRAPQTFSDGAAAAGRSLIPTPLLLYSTQMDALSAGQEDLKVRLFLDGQLLKEEVVHLESLSGRIVIQPFSADGALLKKALFDSRSHQSQLFFSVHLGDQTIDAFELHDLAKLSWQQDRLAPKVGIGSDDFWQATNARIFFGKTLDEVLNQPSQDLSLYYQLKTQPLAQSSGIQSLTITVDEQLFSIDRFEVNKHTTTLALFGGKEKPLRALFDLYQTGHDILLYAKLNGETLEVIPFEGFLDENLALAAHRGWRGQAALQPSFHQWSAHQIKHVARKGDPIQECYDDCDDFEINCISGCSDELCYEQCNYDASDCAQDCWFLEDDDSDGINNGSDNCVRDANPNQQDCDGDGKGTVCDTNDWHVTADTGWSAWSVVGQAYRCRASGFLYVLDIVQCQQRIRTITETNCYNSQTATILLVDNRKIYSCGGLSAFCPPNIGNCFYGSGPCP